MDVPPPPTHICRWHLFTQIFGGLLGCNSLVTISCERTREFYHKGIQCMVTFGLVGIKLSSLGPRCKLNSILSPLRAKNGLSAPKRILTQWWHMLTHMLEKTWTSHYLGNGLASTKMGKRT